MKQLSEDAQNQMQSIQEQTAQLNELKQRLASSEQETEKTRLEGKQAADQLQEEIQTLQTQVR